MQERLNYVEFSSRDLAASKAFFQQVFAWNFQDYGPEYCAFFAAEAGLDGGFYLDREKAPATGALLVFYSAELERCLARAEAAGAHISKAIFSFPGGRRFQFIEPGGNELAVWSDNPAE
ncbi:MAG: VOC family protein [Saccharospirillaceae bacterium]|nr:VOC family protein [Saccharospirillaceae bacterium]MCD8532390.1 VOC family protein [Saccharospirillaceae bacterium]